MNCHNQENQEQKNKLSPVSALFGLLVILFALVVLLKTGNWGSEFIWNISNGGDWLLPLVAVAALIDSINPCAFSILLVTIAFLFSIGKLRSKVLSMGLVYVAGIFAAYMLIGLGLLHVLHIFDTPHFMAKIGAGLLVALGAINLTNEFFPKFPVKLAIPKAAHDKIASLMDKASLPSAFLLGGLVGLCEFPCTGGPYLMVLGLLHDQETYVRGFGYLILYNFIFILPLILILLIAANKQTIERLRSWQKQEKSKMRIFGGISMVILGLLILLI